MPDDQCATVNQPGYSVFILHALQVTLLNLSKLTVVTACIAVHSCESEHVGKL